MTETGQSMSEYKQVICLGMGGVCLFAFTNPLIHVLCLGYLSEYTKRIGGSSDHKVMAAQSTPYQLKTLPHNWTRSCFFSIFHTPVTLNKGQVHLNQYQNVEFRSMYHHSKFEPMWSMDAGMHAHIKVFWHNQYKSSCFPSYVESHSKELSVCSNWTASIPHQISSWSVGKCVRK